MKLYKRILALTFVLVTSFSIMAVPAYATFGDASKQF